MVQVDFLPEIHKVWLKIKKTINAKEIKDSNELEKKLQCTLSNANYLNIKILRVYYFFSEQILHTFF